MGGTCVWVCGWAGTVRECRLGWLHTLVHYSVLAGAAWLQDGMASPAAWRLHPTSSGQNTRQSRPMLLSVGNLFDNLPNAVMLGQAFCQPPGHTLSTHPGRAHPSGEPHSDSRCDPPERGRTPALTRQPRSRRHRQHAAVCRRGVVAPRAARATTYCSTRWRLQTWLTAAGPPTARPSLPTVTYYRGPHKGTARQCQTYGAGQCCPCTGCVQAGPLRRATSAVVMHTSLLV